MKHIKRFNESSENSNISDVNDNESAHTFLEVNFRNNEGYDKWTIIKVPIDWDENEIRKSMLGDWEISEIYDITETGCSDDNYSWDFT